MFSGRWRDYDPWDAAHRTEVYEFPSTVMCSAFRTFQGWTALSDMLPTDGVLHVVPIPSAMAYVLLRALQDDVAADDLCGAVNGQALPDQSEVALPPAARAQSPSPPSSPATPCGGTATSSTAVADDTTQERWGNVMYIPSAPYCEKNAAYAAACGQAFLAGVSPSDFAPEDYEVRWTGRGTVADLNPVGRKQLGLLAW